MLEKCKASAFRDIGTEARRGLTTYLSQNQSSKPVVITAYCMQMGCALVQGDIGAPFCVNAHASSSVECYPLPEKLLAEVRVECVVGVAARGRGWGE